MLRENQKITCTSYFWSLSTSKKKLAIIGKFSPVAIGCGSMIPSHSAWCNAWNNIFHKIINIFPRTLEQIWSCRMVYWCLNLNSCTLWIMQVIIVWVTKIQAMVKFTQAIAKNASQFYYQKPVLSCMKMNRDNKKNMKLKDCISCKKNCCESLNTWNSIVIN